MVHTVPSEATRPAKAARQCAVLLPLALLATPSLALACDGGACTDVGDGQLQLDASLRLRGMYYDPTRFGIGESEDGYGLLRALASARYRQDNWQAMLQLGAHARKPAMAARGCCRCETGRTSAWPSTVHASAGPVAWASWT